MSGKRVLITGASGNLGDKLRRHLEASCALTLLDRAPGGDPAVEPVDLAVWGDWADRFAGIDTVFHLAADPTAQQAWPNLVAPNLDALANALLAARDQGVKRVVFASSNHVMGGYKDLAEPHLLTTDLPPLPGTRYVASGQPRDSTPYASAKLFGERLGRSLALAGGPEFIAARLGWIKPGDNPATGIPAERGDWFRLMWLSNRDYCQLMERCIVADLAEKFVIVNGMSANTGMRWDIEHTRLLLGYKPQDDVTRPA
jgi:nucleoside-diphosphate-sugar epimerase